MNLTKRNRKSWYQICLALLVSVSLIACSDESSSNNDDDSDDSSNEISTRVLDTPDGGTITIAPNPEDPTNSNSRRVTTTSADGVESSITENCNGFSTVNTTEINGVEVDVCEQRS